MKDGRRCELEKHAITSQLTILSCSDGWNDRGEQAGQIALSSTGFDNSLFQLRKSEVAVGCGLSVGGSIRTEWIHTLC